MTKDKYRDALLWQRVADNAWIGRRGGELLATVVKRLEINTPHYLVFACDTYYGYESLEAAMQKADWDRRGERGEETRDAQN